VFIVIAFAAFILVSSVLFAAARSAASKSVGDAVLQLAGRSVLSEFDRTLFQNYGVLAVHGDGAYMERSVKRYADASLGDDEKLREVQIGLMGYSLLDVDNFEGQVVDAVKSGWTVGKDLLRGDNGDGDFGDGANYTHGLEHNSLRALRKSSVVLSLPSQGYESNGFADAFESITADGIPSMDEVLASGTTAFVVNSYIMTIFANRQSEAEASSRFFAGEVEYIIAGNMDDNANYKSVKTRIYAIRLALNNVAILTDSEKMKKLRNLARTAVATGGAVSEVVALAGMIELWALAETDNDLERLKAGHDVAFKKTSEQWALNDVNDILDGIVGSSCVAPENTDGQPYEDYLKLLLFMMNRECKLLRMMDLMQINMKGLTNGEFLIREQFVGFDFSAVSGGDEFVYENAY
jgi:hypothetical protein